MQRDIRANLSVQLAKFCLYAYVIIIVVVDVMHRKQTSFCRTTWRVKFILIETEYKKY